MGSYVLALDQGTTSSRAIIFDKDQNIKGIAQREFTQIYPQEGWVEHDPMDIFSSQYGVMSEVIAKNDISVDEIKAIGITNQRETTILWEKSTGKPIYNAIVWQCRRTSAIVDNLIQQGLDEHIRKTTGLVPDAYFSATKIKWILDHVEGAREKAARGEILFGTVDTWLIWKLTNGEAHVTDYTNASRTMIYDIKKLDWDDTLLKALDIPRAMLPKVCPSSQIYGYANIQGKNIPIAGAAGDQQAALFGQSCFEKGEAKNTYGTGCFLLMNTGHEPCQSQNGLITTIAASIDDKVQYALEGSVFIGGAVIQWLRDELRFISDSRDSGYYAAKVQDTGGVYLVPAFTGLGSPYWDMYARGCMVGITRGTKREHIIRAAEESIAYQSLDLVRAMENDTGIRMQELKVDGGASQDKFLMQFQADIIGSSICRPVVGETTALGAACLAGLAVGIYCSTDEIKSHWKSDITFAPQMEAARRDKLIAGWHKAVGRSLHWEDKESSPV
jgi:glycerol kinase